MPKLKFATDAAQNKFYPISIVRGIVDTDRNQRLNVTLANIKNTADSALTMASYPHITSISIDNETGLISAVVEDYSTQNV